MLLTGGCFKIERMIKAVELIQIKTPCVGVCSTGIGDDVCRGCKRFAHEVVNWNAFSQIQKQHIDSRLQLLLRQIVSAKLYIFDEALLSWQIQVQQLRVNQQHNLYCQLFALLKAGASQVSEPEAFGFCYQSGFESIPLRTLYEQIDQEFYLLSVAHYQRYLLANQTSPAVNL